MQKLIFIVQAFLCLSLLVPQLPASESMPSAKDGAVPHYVVRLRHRLAQIRARNMPSKAVMKDIYKVDAKCPYCYLYGKKNCPKCAIKHSHHKGHSKGHHKVASKASSCKCGGDPASCPCKTCAHTAGKYCQCQLKKAAKKACQTCKLYGKANCSKCKAKKQAKKSCSSCKTYGKAQCSHSKQAKKSCASCKNYGKAQCSHGKQAKKSCASCKNYGKAQCSHSKQAKKACASCKTYGKANCPKCKKKSGSIPRGKLKTL
jgi:hypothetical protein